ncbi:alpha/beta hydrolase [Paenibacillus profundus]|uniref:Alpha/beta hydrolase n=1 Tax=Paenibacillus profundus TaxID=1173085 RepID=A0ABS8YHZ0_9BACL|nr:MULTISPECIES: alpha/beta hydrolase [Paenibacillus]MCE5169980.1 alpha/beta hydrolase [Paenibacillus profundus]
MPLDHQTQAFLEKLKGQPPIESLPPAIARELQRQMGMQAELLSAKEKIQVGAVSDLTIQGAHGEVPIRIYTPAIEGPHPVFVYYHGGGWVLGDLDRFDDICRRVTKSSNCAVVSVDYPLSPENKFPTAVEAAYTAAQWVFDNAEQLQLDPNRLAVGGDSSGGNLAAVVTHLAKERKTLKIAYQVLIYPVTDASMQTATYREFAEGYFLTRDQMTWFFDNYLNSHEEEATNPWVSPLLFTDFTGLPPALVITAEFDPLREESEAYAERMKEAGVPVVLHRYEGTIHPFVSFADEIDKGIEAIEEVADSLRTFFGVNR